MLLAEFMLANLVICRVRCLTAFKRPARWSLDNGNFNIRSLRNFTALTCSWRDCCRSKMGITSILISMNASTGKTLPLSSATAPGKTETNHGSLFFKSVDDGSQGGDG